MPKKKGNLTPKMVAKYAAKDSRALAEVAPDDLLAEIAIRLHEWPHLHAGNLAVALQQIINGAKRKRGGFK